MASKASRTTARPVRSPAQPWRRLHRWGPWVLLLGCDAPAEAGKPGPIAPPACVSVAAFGNGANCSDSDGQLAVCGAAARRTCASGWLCFDAPELADCTCQANADCANRAAYINAGRVSAGKAPLAAKCDGGRCAGAP